MSAYVLNDILISHKLALLRDKNTPTAEFRKIVKEIAMLEGHTIFQNNKIVTETVDIETPIEHTNQEMIVSNSLCFVPILRAGMGMVDGFTELIPNAPVGHIGLYRDEVTKEPHEYYCKLPENLNKKQIVLLDPMLATGGSALAAVDMLIKHGADPDKIIFACIIAAPEGVKAFTEKYPKVPVYIASLDRELNENAYICPGLGDCGDRIFGTVVKEK